MATNYEQAGIEAVNRLFKPMAAGMAAQQGLQRRAGEMALRRQTQLDDAATLREQQLADAATLREQKLTDAATLRSQQLADQKTAQANRLEQITTELSERDKINDQNAEEERERLFAEKKDEVAATIDFLGKNGISIGYTVSDVNKMSQGKLSVAAREANREREAFNLRKKDQTQLIDELSTLARKSDNYEIFKEILDLQETDSKVVDVENFKGLTKSTLIDMLSEARDKIKIRKFGPNMIPEYKSLKKMQYKLMEDTGLLDDITNPTGPGSVLGQQGAEEAAKAIANDPEFQIAISAAGMSDNDMRAVINNLSQGFLMKGAQMLDNEGDLGNTPLLDAYTRWATTSKTAAAVRVQDKLFRAQGASSKLRAINDQLRGMVQRHPWLEQAVDTTDIFSSEEFDRIANRQRQGGQGGGATTTTMTPLGPVERTGAAATNDGLGDIAAVNEALNLAGEEESARLENVEVEGGLPSDEKLKVAQEILGEGYGEGLMPSIFGGGGRGWFKPTLTPDRMVQEAQDKIANRKKMIELKLNEFGANRDPSTKKVKVSQTNEGTVERLKKWYEASDGQAGLGSGLSDVEPTIPAVRPLTLDEIRKRGAEANQLFDELDKIEQQLKTLQLNAPRQTTLKP